MAAEDLMTSETELRHLRREIRTALELAIVAMAPSDLLERLAASAGYLEALVELPADSAPVRAFIPSLVKRANESLEDFRKWQNKFDRV